MLELHIMKVSAERWHELISKGDCLQQVVDILRQEAEAEPKADVRHDCDCPNCADERKAAAAFASMRYESNPTRDNWIKDRFLGVATSPSLYAQVWGRAKRPEHFNQVSNYGGFADAINARATETRELLFDLCELLMVSDPWPCLRPGSRERIEAEVNTLAQSEGFANWIDAYHAKQPEPEARLTVDLGNGVDLVVLDGRSWSVDVLRDIIKRSGALGTEA